MVGDDEEEGEWVEVNDEEEDVGEEEDEEELSPEQLAAVPAPPPRDAGPLEQEEIDIAIGCYCRNNWSIEETADKLGLPLSEVRAAIDAYIERAASRPPAHPRRRLARFGRSRIRRPTP